MLYNGDCIEVLKTLKTNSIDLIFADPPYFLSNGGKSIHSGKVVSVNKGDWDDKSKYDNHLKFTKDWLTECYRVLKFNGSIWTSGTVHNIFDIKQFLDENEVYSKLEKLITKKIKSNTTKSSYALKQKIIYDMKNLGYDISMINEILDNLNISSNNNVISKEYSKLYRKLSNKYEGEELSRQIYYKLRSKGFTDEEITNIKI